MSVPDNQDVSLLAVDAITFRHGFTRRTNVSGELTSRVTADGGQKVSDSKHDTADGVWCVLGEPRTVAQIGQSGFAWIGLDMQHGAFDDTSLMSTMQMLSTLPQSPMVAVRVAELSDARIGRALDLGADIVIVPMIETVEQAQQAVAAAYYPPNGRRSWGSLVSQWGHVAPTPAASNPEVWVMLETPAGVEAAEEILAVPGVAAVFVGPFDLAIGLGVDVTDLLKAQHADDPLPRIVAAARRTQKQTGAFAGDPTRAEALRSIGFSRVAVATDSALLALGAASVLGHDAGTTLRTY